MIPKNLPTNIASMFRIRKEVVASRRLQDPRFSASSHACRILEQSLKIDLSERRFQLRREDGEIDSAIRQMVTGLVASADLHMFGLFNGTQVVALARQVRHFRCQVPQDQQEAEEDQCRAEGLLYTALLTTAATGGEEGAERACLALAQGLEAGILSGPDCLSAANYLIGLNYTGLAREVIRATRMMLPSNQMVRDRAADMLESLPLEVLRDVRPPPEEGELQIDLDQGRVLEREDDAASDKTEQYAPSPLALEPYVPSPAPSEPYVPSPAPSEPYVPSPDRVDRSFNAAPEDQGSNSGEDDIPPLIQDQEEEPGQEDVILLEPAGTQKPVGRVPGHRRQEQQEGHQPRGVAVPRPPGDAHPRSSGRGRGRGLGIRPLANSIIEAVETGRQRRRTESPELRRPDPDLHREWQQSLRTAGRGRGRGRGIIQVTNLMIHCSVFLIPASFSDF